MSLDGVVESPFSWATPYFSDEMFEVIRIGIAQADAILLGRRTYLEFAEMWPSQDSFRRARGGVGWRFMTLAARG